MGESIASLQSCCARAREAAQVSRYRAAHELFQNALAFFERARGVTWDDSDELYLWQHACQLSRARRELDECAAVIYPAPMALESGSEVLQDAAPFDEAYRIQLSRFLATKADPTKSNLRVF